MNLVLIEGINGSGKSSTAHQLGLHLAHLGREVQWWFEQDERAHPLYTGASPLAYDRSYSPEERQGMYRELLARWRALVASLEGTQKIVVLEGGFLQMVIDFCLLLNVPAEEAQAHVLAVAEILAPLDPLLILLYQEDTGAALQKILADRSTAWADYLVDLYRRSPYGQAHELRDYVGVIQAITQSRRLVNAIFDRLNLQKLAVETSAGDWPRYYRRITDTLGVPPLAPSSLSAGADRFTGSYRLDGTEEICRVTAGTDALYISRQARLRLLPKAENSFHVLGTRWEINFAVADGVRAHAATFSEPGVGILGVLNRASAV